MEIDWAKLARELDCYVSGVYTSDDSRRAIELLLGEESLRSSVEYYVAVGAHRELTRMVLWQLRPWSAMQHCYEIFKSTRELCDRRAAVELLRVVADRRVLPWIPEFLADPDLDIQAWGASVLDQLTFSQLVAPEEAEELLCLMERHEYHLVRERATRIRGFLAQNE